MSQFECSLIILLRKVIPSDDMEKNVLCNSGLIQRCMNSFYHSHWFFCSHSFCESQFTVSQIIHKHLKMEQFFLALVADSAYQGKLSRFHRERMGRGISTCTYSREKTYCYIVTRFSTSHCGKFHEKLQSLSLYYMVKLL